MSDTDTQGRKNTAAVAAGWPITKRELIEVLEANDSPDDAEIRIAEDGFSSQIEGVVGAQTREGKPVVLLTRPPR